MVPDVYRDNLRKDEKRTGTAVSQLLYPFFCFVALEFTKTVQIIGETGNAKALKGLNGII